MHRNISVARRERGIGCDPRSVELPAGAVQRGHCLEPSRPAGSRRRWRELSRRRFRRLLWLTACSNVPRPRRYRSCTRWRCIDLRTYSASCPVRYPRRVDLLDAAAHRDHLLHLFGLDVLAEVMEAPFSETFMVIPLDAMTRGLEIYVLDSLGDRDLPGGTDPSERFRTHLTGALPKN